MPAMQETKDFSGGEDFQDVNARIQDLEERQRLIKDRVIIMGKNLIGEREKTNEDILSLKKEVLLLKEENIKLKENLYSMTEKLNNTVRREELMILKRQLDLLRGERSGSG